MRAMQTIDVTELAVLRDAMEKVTLALPQIVANGGPEKLMVLVTLERGGMWTHKGSVDALRWEDARRSPHLMKDIDAAGPHRPDDLVIVVQNLAVTPNTVSVLTLPRDQFGLDVPAPKAKETLH